jgi:hypothetical protein
MTNALHGSFTPADAVTRIIAGTSLTFAMADELPRLTALLASYKVDSPYASWLDDKEIVLTATNLLDRDPPFANNELAVGYDLLNGSLRGRALGFTVRKQW